MTRNIGLRQNKLGGGGQGQGVALILSKWAKGWLPIPKYKRKPGIVLLYAGYAYVLSITCPTLSILVGLTLINRELQHSVCVECREGPPLHWVLW